MASPPEKDMVQRFQELTQDFKAKTDEVMSEITGVFGANMNAAVKNYTEMINNYAGGYTGIASGAQKANSQLLQNLEKHYDEFKKQFSSIYAETVSKTDGAISTGTSDFKTQCEDIIKKFPMIPDKTFKDVLNSVMTSKGTLNSELEKQYKDVLGKIEKNFQTVKKELTFPQIKAPTLPPLDVGGVNASKGALASAVNIMPPALKNQQQPSSSKK